MITHFAELQLNTVSIRSIKQFYHDILQFPICLESSKKISFKPTEELTLTFEEAFMPISPVHLAFEVPYSQFNNVISILRRLPVNILKCSDGNEVVRIEHGENVYFRDADGNLLEFITHHYVNEEVLQSRGMFNILYLREIGFPVKSVKAFREWLVRVLNVKTDKESDHFTFAIAGTAHNVLSSIHRRWIPISMVALPPRMKVVYGVTDTTFINTVKPKLEKDELISDGGDELQFKKYDYHFTLRVTDYGEEIPGRLNLPHSR